MVAMAELCVSVPVTVQVVVGADMMDLEAWELFQALRRKWNLTQAEVALGAGTAQSEVSRWERGRRMVDPGVESLYWQALLALVAAKRSELLSEAGAA